MAAASCRLDRRKRREPSRARSVLQQGARDEALREPRAPRSRGSRHRRCQELRWRGSDRRRNPANFRPQMDGHARCRGQRVLHRNQELARITAPDTLAQRGSPIGYYDDDPGGQARSGLPTSRSWPNGSITLPTRQPRFSSTVDRLAVSTRTGPTVTGRIPSVVATRPPNQVSHSMACAVCRTARGQRQIRKFPSAASRRVAPSIPYHRKRQEPVFWTLPVVTCGPRRGAPGLPICDVGQRRSDGNDGPDRPTCVSGV